MENERPGFSWLEDAHGGMLSDIVCVNCQKVVSREEMNIYDGGREIQECPHKEHALPTHPCPFQSEVHKDPDFRCTCCDECSQNCSDNI